MPILSLAVFERVVQAGTLLAFFFFLAAFFSSTFLSSLSALAWSAGAVGLFSPLSLSVVAELASTAFSALPE